MRTTFVVPACVLLFLFAGLSGCTSERVDCFNVFVSTAGPNGETIESKISTVRLARDDFYLSLAPADTAVRLSRCSTRKAN